MFTQKLFKNLTDHVDPSPKQEALALLHVLEGIYFQAAEVKALIHFVIDAVNGKKLLNGDVIRKAAILDSLTKNTHLTRKLLELGATYHATDIDDIRPINKQVSRLLEMHSRPRAKI